MAYVPTLHRAMEIRFYLDNTLQSSKTIYGRRESRSLEFQARGLGGAGSITRQERVAFTTHADVTIDEALLNGNPPRIYDEETGQEYLVQSLSETARRDRIMLSCVALPPGQP